MKDFLLLANVNAVTYKEFFPLLKEGKARGGYNFNKTIMFETPEGEKPGPNIAWFTTLHTPDKRKLILTKRYHKEDYPHYDNYNAIEVSKIKDIPYDYDCVMGVPITIFGYDLDNVEVRQLCASHGKTPRGIENENCYINGKWKYPRVLIKKKIVIMGDKTINGKDTHINGKEKYRRVCIRLTRRKK